MCRIAGIVSRTLPLPEIENLVTRMCDLQKHGGPDDSGLYSCQETKVVLGHRRLALIDLSPLGHQPMFYRERYVISFNGEIYNFPDLKKELLQLGYIFKTNSDTEIILAAFAKWNTQSFSRLAGMFSFALYDIIEKSLYLVRDPSGIKPMYYASCTYSMEFASEIRAFSVLDKEENKKWPIYQLAYGHIPEPVTTLQDVQPLHKGCFFQYNVVTGCSSLQSYAHYSYSNRLKNQSSVQNTIKETIEKAVGRHLLSDAPIGVFLSGGIDSGIITTLAASYKKEHLKTLSLYFNEKKFSEKKYQDDIIDQLQCKFHQHLLSEAEFQESFSGILQNMDMPSCDGINTWFISKYAKKEGLKAVLSGIGGDELFGGYPSFNRISIALQLQKMPVGILRLSSKSSVKKINRLPYLSIAGIKGLYLFLRGQFIPLQVARQLNMSEQEVWSVLKNEPALSPLSCLSKKNEASWMELNMYMQNQLLRDADVMSMAHGIEIRVPFLDDEVIKASLSIDSRIKYQGTLSKQILIDAFKDKLPESIWNRKKMGFSFPFTQWLKNSEFVKDTMHNSNRISQESYQRFMEGRLHWSHLMSLIILQTRGVA